MTKQEALQIPELQITPDELVEDCFFYKMAKAGKIPSEHAEKALRRLEDKVEDPCFEGAFIVADMMIANIEKYGLACAAWAK